MDDPVLPLLGIIIAVVAWMLLRDRNREGPEAASPYRPDEIRF
jgi:hypothetical protein